MEVVHIPTMEITLSFDGIDDLVEINQSVISSSQNTFSAMFNAAESL